MIELGDIIIAVVALVFSALFSAYEISFLSSNKLIIELDRKEGQRYAIAMQPYLQNPDKLISSLLMGNNVVMVIYGLAMANILNPVIERYITENIAGVLLLETTVATIIVLITGEFIPSPESIPTEYSSGFTCRCSFSTISFIRLPPLPDCSPSQL